MKNIIFSVIVASSLFSCDVKDSLQTPSTQEVKDIVNSSEKKSFDVRHYNSF